MYSSKVLGTAKIYFVVSSIEPVLFVYCFDFNTETDQMVQLFSCHRHFYFSNIITFLLTTIIISGPFPPLVFINFI